MLRLLVVDRQHRDIAWRIGVDDDVMSDGIRRTELSNWIASLVLK